MTSPEPLPLDPGRALPLADDAATAALGQTLGDLVLQRLAAGEWPPDGFTMHFSGELGAGKTTLVRALLRRLGVVGRIKSPTYTLVEQYEIGAPKLVDSRERVNLYCYHFDFYRFEDPEEWIQAGFRDHFSDAALRLVEWPERALSADGSLLPPPDVAVQLAYRGDGRVASLSASTPRGVAWLTGAGPAPRPPAVDGS